jgi:signal transduction histidine kinase
MSRGHAALTRGLGEGRPGPAPEGNDAPDLVAAPQPLKPAPVRLQEPPISSVHERLVRFQQRRIQSVVVTPPLGRAERVRRLLLDAPELDVGIVAVAFGALLVDPLLSFRSQHLNVADFALAAVTALPLVARRRYPLAVLVLVIGGALGCLALFEPKHAAVAVVMLAVYTVGLQGRRRSSLLVGVAMVPAVALAAAILPHRHFDALEVLAYLALLLFALVAGDARRGRLALIEAAQERAEQEREAMVQHRFDEQRLRLAHELHDTIGHALVAVNVRAAAAAHLRRHDPDESLDALEEIKRTSADALAELRSTLKMLRSVPDEAPLRPAQSLEDLQDLVHGLEGVGISVDLQVAQLDHSVPEAIEHAAYRIVQEALTNVLRHSDARTAVVKVALVGDALSVEVVDDGRTASPPSTVVGHGLQGMAERAAELGGHCEAGVVAGGGWRVAARLPVPVTER